MKVNYEELEWKPLKLDKESTSLLKEINEKLSKVLYKLSEKENKRIKDKLELLLSELKYRAEKTEVCLDFPNSEEATVFISLDDIVKRIESVFKEELEK